jgi:exosome complex RNA-binding protein Rrp4
VSLDFKVFIKQKFLDQGICSFSSLDKIVRQCDIDDMLIDPTLEVPDVQGKILVIKGKSLDKKADAFTALMRILQDSEAVIYIPHTLVSMVIGAKGRTINQIKKDSQCEIFVNQQLQGLPLCSIQLKTANPRQQGSTCRTIYEILERNARDDDLKTVYVKPLAKTEIKTIAKFVIAEDSQGYLIGKHGVFTKQLEDIHIYMHCGKETANKALMPREAVCSLEGYLKDIEEATRMVLHRLQSFYEASKKDYELVPLALLIPYNLVTKIIGAGGSLIQQLVQKTGAQIRVSCSKNDPYTEEVVVTIDGTLE